MRRVLGTIPSIYLLVIILGVCRNAHALDTPAAPNPYNASSCSILIPIETVCNQLESEANTLVIKPLSETLMGLGTTGHEFWNSFSSPVPVLPDNLGISAPALPSPDDVFAGIWHTGRWLESCFPNYAGCDDGSGNGWGQNGGGSPGPSGNTFLK